MSNAAPARCERPAGRRVVVTGGLGFIGAHLCRALTDRGYQVLALDRRRGGRLTDIEARRVDLSTGALRAHLVGADAVVHLVALPGARARHPLGELWRHNVRATERVIEAMPSGCRLLFASTSSVYGDAAEVPTPEGAPTRPLNPYAASKLAAERAALAAAGRGTDAVICRLFTVYGPGQRDDMAFARWIRAIRAGRPVAWCARPGARREFTYVGDAVRGLVAALERGRPGRVYNVAGAGSTPVRSALAELEELLGRPALLSIRPGAPEATVTAACGRRALAELGYAPAVTLREGLERQVAASIAEPAREARLPATAAA